MKTRRVPFDINKAKSGAKIVTRAGYPVRIGFFDLKLSNYPIVGAILQDGQECICLFTEEGKLSHEHESKYDLFIEEEEEEDDDYNPYKATVESLADMVERYAELQSLEELKDFYNNVKIKCRDAFEYGRVCMINQDEEPADNKPKFKVGDWVIDIDKQGVVHQITNVIKNVANHTYGYNAETYTYGVFGYSYFSKNVKSMRLWDIKDAKDGDVLVCIGKYGQEIGIVKKYVGKYGGCDKCFKTYCYIDWEGIFRIGEYMGSKEIYPATKEQRDTLFQKIKEEGYEWDSNKKELKKIKKEAVGKAKKEVKTRRMTNQELAWWLRKCPEERREYKYKDCSNIHNTYNYYEDEADNPCLDDVLIRKNGGEWQEPLVEE